MTLTDLGAFVAYWQSEAVHNMDKAHEVDHKHSVNLKGDDWSFGLAYDNLAKSKKCGMKATY